MKKRVLSLLIATMMIFGSLPIAAGDETISTYRDYFPLEDISENEWYTFAVKFCYVNTFMKGVSDDRFDPSTYTTREQMMMIMANMMNEDVSDYTQTSFIDVKEGEWYTSAIAWAEACGYTKGIGNGKFGLGKTITREETVVVFYEYVSRNSLGTHVGKELDSFVDANEVSDWALEAMSWAISAGVIKGNDKNMLDPKGILSRAQAAQMIYNVQLNCMHTYHEHEFTDATCTEPSKCVSKDEILGECQLLLAPAKGHSVYRDLICEEFTQCIDCGEDVYEPLGHEYLAATCTEPMTCKRCYKTLGEALGHTTETEVCLRCGISFFANANEKLVYFLKNKGMTKGETKYFYTAVTYTGGTNADQYITYNGKDVYFENTFKFASSSDTAKISLKLDPSSDTLNYTFEYTKGALTPYSGSGTIKASAYIKGQKLTFTSYSGDANRKADVENILTNSMALNIDGAGYLLNLETGMTLSELGFTSCK